MTNLPLSCVGLPAACRRAVLLLFFLVCFSCSTVAGSSSGTTNVGMVPSTRIVGGERAVKGRYPYMVALLTRKMRLQCGGTLIAPNVVLTAAHCALGIMANAVIGSLDLNATYSQWEQGGGFTNSTNETVIKIQHQIIHPLWDPEWNRYDIMIVVLETSALPNQPVVTLNQNSSLPTTTTVAGSGGDDDDEQVLLTAIGYGRGSSDPLQLHNVTLGYVPNAQCKVATNGTLTYEDLVHDEMMCTLAVNRSVCFGDSGGPLLLTASTGDIQLGVMSWLGERCGHPTFPNVYSRTSESFDFIRQQVCEFAPDTASQDYNCAELRMAAASSSTDLPTAEVVPSAPTLSPAPTMRMQPCLIWIVMDKFAFEIGWKLKDSVTQEYVIEVPITTYSITDDEVVVTVNLIPGRGYRFIIVDEYGDGLLGSDTGYSVILGTDLKNGVRLLQGKGTFGARGGRSFTVPDADATMPSLATSSSTLPASGTPSVAPSSSTTATSPMISPPSPLSSMPMTTTTNLSQSVVPGTIPFSASIESGSAASISVSFWSGNKRSLWLVLVHTAAASAAMMAWF